MRDINFNKLFGQLANYQLVKNAKNLIQLPSGDYMSDQGEYIENNEQTQKQILQDKTNVSKIEKMPEGFNLQDPASTSEYIDTLNVAMKLADQVTEEDGARTTIGAAEGEAKLATSDLENIGTLVKFLADNKILVNGSSVAENAPPGFSKKDTAPSGLDHLELPIGASSQTWYDEQKGKEKEPNKTGLVNEPTRQDQYMKPYFVNKEALKKFLYDLKQKSSTNKVMEVMVSKLFDQANRTVFRQHEQIQKTAPVKTYVVKDTDDICYIPSSLTAENFMEKGDKILYFQNIKTPYEFYSWLEKAPALNITKDNKKVAFDRAQLGNGFDACFVLQALYNRAKKSVEFSGGNALQNEKFKAFLKVVTELTPQIKGPNGQACNISNFQDMSIKQDVPSPEKAKSKGDGKNPNEPGGAAPSAEQAKQAAMVNVASFLSSGPLYRDRIDLKRIDQFLIIAKAFVGTDADAQIAVVKKLLDNPTIKSLPSYRIDLGSLAFKDFSIQVSPSKSSNRFYYDSLINAFEEIVKNTQNIVYVVIEQLGHMNEGKDDKTRESLEKQLTRGSDFGTIKQNQKLSGDQNLTALNSIGIELSRT